MFKNILKIAFRNTLRDRGYSLLNLLGLTISISASLLLILYITHELSYEATHLKKDRIFRIVSHFQERDDAFSWASTQPPLGPQIKEDYPEIEEFVRINGMGGNTILTYNDISYSEDELALADSTYFKIFTHKFIEGDMNTCLDEPNSIVLTKTLAEKYFGEEKALGKTLKDNDNESIKVTGVIEDLPRNTHLDFKGLVSLNSIERLGGGWGSFYLITYVLLKENVNSDVFKPKVDEMIVKYVDPIFETYGVAVQYEMQNIPDIHLYSKTDGEEGGGDISYIYIFSIVVFFMLIIAAINYMNLATARSERRSKEVGIRKVMGSYRWMLTLQFITESLILTISALLISLLLIDFVLLNPFNSMTSREFFFSDLLNTELVLSMVGMIVLLGILGGSYPAFYLSSFKPVSVLKGKFVQGKQTIPLRKVLVVTQFAISIAMIISTLVVFDQLNFLKNKDLGFASDKVMVMRFNNREMGTKFEVLRTALLENPGIKNVSSSSSSPGDGYPKNLLPVETKDGFVEKGVNYYNVDHNYLPTLEIKLVEGRNFSKDLASDSNAVVVNQLFAKRNDWDEPIGMRIRLSDEEDETQEYATVVGVIEDFHQLSLYQEMEPMAFFYETNNSFVHINFNPESMESVQKHLETKWTELFPDSPFEPYFLDQNFYENYESDQKRSEIFTLFSIITIFIACVGLLGLASFTAEQRTKEIGIRKVIGASIPSIILLLTKEFFILILISMIFAFGASYYLMTEWLDSSFVYHTSIQFVSFIYAAFLTFLFVMITVGYHAYRAAASNPINALRSE